MATAAHTPAHASETARKPAAKAAVSQRSEVVFRGKKKGRKTGPSVQYKPDIFGNYLTEKFLAEVEAHYDRLVYRHDPRKIIRAISKRTGATEEAVAHILLVGKLRQYRAESREFRRWIAEALPRVAQAGAASWERKTA